MSTTEVERVEDQVRELSPEERQARAEHAKKIEDRIIADIQQGRAAAWDLAEAFYEFHEANGHTALGYETQEEWLAQPEIGFTRVAFFRLIRRYRELVVYREVPKSKLAELEPSKLDVVLPSIEGNVRPLSEMLDDVKTLGARDLREKYLGERGRSNRGEGEVVDSTARDVEEVSDDSRPVSHEQVDETSQREADQLQHAIDSLDSWIEMGGDRRKAQRALNHLLELHPVLVAITRIQQAVVGGDEALDRESVQDDWQRLASALQLPRTVTN